MKRLIFLLAVTLISSACGAQTPAAEPQVVSIYATSAASPWLERLYSCAAKSSIVLNMDAKSPEISLRVGEPNVLASLAFQIDEEEILVAVPHESPVQKLTLTDVQNIFMRGDPLGATQVLVYPSDADVQMAFDQLVMEGRSVTSFANVAVSPQNMSARLSLMPNAIGILPRSWLTGEVREVFSVGRVPVLAVTRSEPQGVVVGLLSCLQDN